MSRNEKLELIISVEDSKIGRNRKLFVEIFSKLKGEYKVTIQKSFRKRTNLMNAFYFGVIIQLVMKGLWDVGITIDAESTHKFLAARFLKEEVFNDKTGESIEIIKSTTSLSTVGFQEYWIQIREFADTFLSVYIPDPDPEIFRTQNEKQI